MRCRQARGLFGAYWDDELTQAEREWLESHFGICAACRVEYESLARVLELTGALPRAEVGPGFAERVLIRARRASVAPDRIPTAAPRWIPITAAAALLAIVGAMTLQWTGPGLVPGRPRTAGNDVRLVQGGPPQAVPTIDPTRPAEGPWMAAGQIPDSLFDHGEDVEFILDPVTLRKGRAHTVVRVPQAEVRGEPAIIAF